MSSIEFLIRDLGKAKKFSIDKTKKICLNCRTIMDSISEKDICPICESIVFEKANIENNDGNLPVIFN